jgi:hypothetical protein
MISIADTGFGKKMYPPPSYLELKERAKSFEETGKVLRNIMQERDRREQEQFRLATFMPGH